MIAAAEAERKVMITLELVAGQQNSDVAQKLNSQVQDIQKKAKQLSGGGTKKPINPGIVEAKKWGKAIDQMISVFRKAEEQRIKDLQKVCNKTIQLIDNMNSRLEESCENSEKRRTNVFFIQVKKRDKIRSQEEKAVRKLESAIRLQIDSRHKATEAGVGALQGTLDLVEGMASLGLVSEDNFEKFSKGFEKIQAGFKALKGLTELYWKGREAIVALNEASKAKLTIDTLLANNTFRLAASQAAANAAEGVAGGAVGGATGRGAGGAASGLAAEVGGDVAGGALGAKMVGGGAGSSAGIGLLAKAGGAAGWLTLAAAGGIALFESIQFVKRGIFGATEANEGFVSSITGWRKAVSDAADSTERLENQQKDYGNRQKLAQREGGRLSREGGYRSARQDSEAMNRRVAFEAGGGADSPIAAVEQERIEGLKRVWDAEKELADFEKANVKRTVKGHHDQVEERLRLSQRLADQERQLVETDLQRLQVLRDQKKVAEEQMKVQADAIKSAQDAQKSELQRYSELSKHQKGRLQEVSDKVTRGEKLDERDIRLLERTGQGAEIVRDYRSQQGAEEGGVAVLSALNGRFKDAKKQENEARKELSDQQKKKQNIDTQQPAAIRDLQTDNRTRDATNAKQVDAQREIDDRALQQQAMQEAKDDIESPVYEGTLLDSLTFGFFLSDKQKRLKRRQEAEQEAARGSNPFIQNQGGGEIGQAPNLIKRQPEQAAANAADEVAQSGIGVEQALKGVLSAVAQNNAQMQASIENSDLMKGYYNV